MNIGGYLSADLLSAGWATVTSRSVGTFHFDAVTSEMHESTLRITENPVESGAAVADHVVLEPKGLTITGIMVDYEPPGYAKSILGVDTGIIGKLPLPMSISAVTTQAISMASRYISLAESVAESAVRVVAPFLPDYLGFSVDASATVDRVGKAYNDLLNIQKSGEPINVQTGLKLYEKMLITSVSPVQTSKGSAEFTLTLKELFIVESQTTSGLNSDQKKTQQKTTQMGNTQPKEAETSVIWDIFK